MKKLLMITAMVLSSNAVYANTYYQADDGSYIGFNNGIHSQCYDTAFGTAAETCFSDYTYDDRIIDADESVYQRMPVFLPTETTEETTATDPMTGETIYIVGPAGPAGPAGANGMDGTNGTNGTNGQDGRDGTNGVDGRDGSDGAPGADGRDGLDGQNGQDGRDGIDGKDGKDGSVTVIYTIDQDAIDAQNASVAATSSARVDGNGYGFGIGQSGDEYAFSFGAGYNVDNFYYSATITSDTQGNQSVGVGFRWRF